jgi:catechol 2,3-dioxygenase-like lactoylglutathione lyase family enzyme
VHNAHVSEDTTTDHLPSDHDATDHDATDHDATDHDATDHDATDHDATDHDAMTASDVTAPLVPLGFDHVVLRCADVETTLAWYLAIGLSPVRVDEWRSGDAPFPSVRISADSIIDLVRHDPERGGTPTPTDGRLDHLCIAVAPTDLQALADSGRFDVLEGPARRYGARGMGTSLYVRDPDGVTVELRHY